MEQLRQLAVEYASTYKPPAVVKAFNGVPRFGHTSDIGSVYENGSFQLNNATDYVQGTVFIAGICLTVFILWILALLICKIFGKKAGIAAGKPFEQTTKELPKRHLYWRLFMIASSFVIIVNGLVFLIAGAQSVRRVFNDVWDGATGLSNIADDIVNATNKVIAFGEETVPLKDELVVELQNVCTADGQAGIQDQFDAAATTVVSVLGQLQDFSNNELIALRDTFEVEFNQLSDDFNGGTESVEKWAQPWAVAVPVFLFGFILAIGSYMAWKGPYIPLYFKIQGWAVLPLFSLVVILMAFVLSITGTVLVINSDVCLGGDTRSPEGFLDEVLTKFAADGEIDEDTMAASRYYLIDGCQGSYDRYTDVTSLLSNLEEAEEGITSIKEMTSNSPEDIINLCGVSAERLAELDGLMDRSQTAFSDFVTLAQENVELLDCEPINDVFVDFYHDALCTSGPYALMWIFATMMSVYGLGMAMILFRGALFPSIVMYEEDYEEGDGLKPAVADAPVYDLSSNTSSSDNKEKGKENHHSDTDSNDATHEDEEITTEQNSGTRDVKDQEEKVQAYTA